MIDFLSLLSWSLRCFRKLWYHLRTMYACVAKCENSGTMFPGPDIHVIFCSLD